jgi:hypothetical protein
LVNSRVLEPPELREPYRTDDERAEAIVQLVRLDQRLQEWAEIQSAATGRLPAEHRSVLSKQPLDPGDSPELKLARWITVFGDDISAVHDARSRIVHGVWLPDFELRSALWIGNRLLRLLENQEPHPT